MAGNLVAMVILISRILRLEGNTSVVENYSHIVISQGEGGKNL